MTSDKSPILLVEDEFLIAIDVQMRLQEAGYPVLNPVGSVEEALAILDEQPVGAAILDMNLRGTTSTPIAERLQADGTPFVFLSGNDTYHQDEKFANHPVLTKPIDYANLIGQMKAFCGY
jgi:DNA-binding response OmpR family regulator